MEIKYDGITAGGICQETFITNSQIEELIKTSPLIVDITISEDGVPEFSDLDFDPTKVEKIYQNSNEVKMDREYDLNNLVVEYNNNVFDADEVSQGRISRAIQNGSNLNWVLANNNSIEVSQSDLQKILNAAVSKQDKIWNKYQIIRSQLKNN